MTIDTWHLANEWTKKHVRFYHCPFCTNQTLMVVRKKNERSARCTHKGCAQAFFEVKKK